MIAFHCCHAPETNSSLNPAFVSCRLLFTEIVQFVASFPRFKINAKSSRNFPYRGFEVDSRWRAEFRLDRKYPLEHLYQKCRCYFGSVCVATTARGFGCPRQLLKGPSF